MPLETPVRIARELARRGYNAEREALTLLANAPDSGAALDAAVEAAPDDALRLTVSHVRSAVDADGPPPDAASAGAADSPTPDPSVSTAAQSGKPPDGVPDSPVETKGSGSAAADAVRSGETPAPTVTGDITGRSTGTGEYGDFVSVFRDRYETLSGKLRGRVNHRPASAIEDMAGGNDVAMIGLVNDVRSSASGHWIVELEDTTGTFPCMITKDRDLAGVVD